MRIREIVAAAIPGTKVEKKRNVTPWSERPKTPKY